ncbi:hypothetical protein GCM10010965_27500 [Caldalkalibacillus thermarum]|uniref:DUF6075 family protein n=1 Tax=Caldalkalibacillus thermarum TaxID=296745 RepID=UPI001665D207|nr:DUF6075 family protein [Caldalkalibacillus thermarum]GGK33170.1 hypothetical protein GCM10010965_27500 [Caldalkalibacillus thermarum]
MIIPFTSKEHEKTFFKMRSDLPDEYKNNIEHLSLIYLLSGNEELRQKALPYYKPDEGVFLFTDMFEEQDFSSGIRVLAKLAVVLYNRGMEVTVNELFKLDRKNLWLALEATKLRLRG